MNIHKTKIEWCSHTWNPVTGCRHDCPYCYARRIATRFGPKIDEFPDESGITAFINEGVACYVVEKPTELTRRSASPPPPSSSAAWQTCSGAGCRTTG